MSKHTLSKTLISISIIALSFSAFIFISQTTKFLPSTSHKIKILIVPGHEPNAGGADEFKKIKERDLNLQLSEFLKKDLSANPSLEVILARDKNGWNKDLKNYVMKYIEKISDKEIENVEMPFSTVYIYTLDKEGYSLGKEVREVK